MNVVYEVENTSDRPMTGAGRFPSYGPQIAGAYFRSSSVSVYGKQSFGRANAAMPVVFWVDPEAAEGNRHGSRFHYTFSRSKEQDREYDVTPYILPQPSRWPVTGACALLLSAAGAAMWINHGSAGPTSSLPGCSLLFTCCLAGSAP